MRETADAPPRQIFTRPGQGGENRCYTIPGGRNLTTCLSTTLQTRLNELGSDLAVDGSFGGKTEDEVYAFQGRSRIGFDGIVGPTTRSYLANPGTVRLTRASASTIGAYIDAKFGSAAPTARRIASCESSYRETAINTNTNGGIDIGVFQMNTIHDGGNRTAFAHDLLCYKTNVDKAYQLYQQSGGFGPW